MKKSLLTGLLALMVLVLAACATPQTDSGSQADQVNPNTSSETTIDSNNSSDDSTATANEAEVLPESVTVVHAFGETEVPTNPQNIIVYDFGILDTLHALGIDAHLAIPADNLPDYLVEAYPEGSYTNLGGLFDVDAETIFNFEPDLIILGARQADFYEELSDIAPTIGVQMYDTQHYMEEASTMNLAIGRIFGKEDLVQEKLEAINSDIASLKEKASASGKTGLILLTNDGNISAYGSGSRFGIIHDVFGITPVDPDIEASTHGSQIGFEYIAEKNPDMIFAVDRTVVAGGSVDGSQTLENELVEQTTAYQNDDIHFLNPSVWYLSGGTGLESIGLMIDEMSSYFE